MNIDFVEPTLPSRRMWALVSLPIGIALFLGCVLIALRAKFEAQREQLAAAVVASQVKPAALAIRVPPPLYQAQGLAAVKRAALPEADALAELEHVQVVGIQLRSIEVNPIQAVIDVEIDAVSDAALGDYLDQLNAGAGPPRWHIQKLTVRTREAGPNTAPVSRESNDLEGHSVLIAGSF